MHSVLAGSVNFFEPREVLQGNEAVVKYHVLLTPSTSLSWLSQQLMSDGTAGLKSVSWSDPPKKGG